MHSSSILLAGLSALLLALIHIIASRFKFLKRLPRSRWLSLSSGVSVAYVFVHVLPDLSEAQSDFQENSAMLSAVEHHVYIVALLGMIAFYGLEKAAKVSRYQSVKEGQGDETQPGVFWLHMVSFGLYNALIGYLLMHREEPGLRDLWLYVIAMALHFLVNDYSLWEDHKRAYSRVGKWILAAAVICGWVIGTQTKIDEAITAILFAFLAGGIILNILKEELPQERESRFWMFALGAAGYSSLLLVL
ncbi:hypothetical protein S7335_5292 [Synechococcus sp. PCC 7335]|uniref:hypothetical protein n=1 Tax=Synechococcus sp. (strain ATCC 29403 / PCC 7335) TaxID=91464 RepID=UPI00017EBBBC|nr:hypothetical protein [Synechococcus sp. PCC 7335]EDX87582.1 hypothetical protein S7335_5292 [Synechococcus sp. PCC 7335]